MSLSFELINSDTGLFAFNGLDTKGKVLLMGAEFTNKAETEKAIQDVRVGSMMSQNIAVGDDSDGKKFFVIKNQAGDVLVKSITFADEMEFNQALHTVRDGACIAEVTDLTN